MDLPKLRIRPLEAHRLVLAAAALGGTGFGIGLALAAPKLALGAAPLAWLGLLAVVLAINAVDRTKPPTETPR